MALSKEEIAVRYSTALFGYAQDMKALDQVHEQMNALQKAVQANPRIINLLSDPLINSEQKQKVLIAITKPFSAEVQNFLHLLLSYDRFADLNAIIDRFNHLYDQKKKIAFGVATTAFKLDAQQLKRLCTSAAKRCHLKHVYLKDQVDPAILGGVILQIGDRVVDGSVRNKLQKIRALITNDK